MRAGLGGLQRFDEADLAEGLRIDRPGAIGHGVLHAEIDLVHADLVGEFADDALDAEDHLRHAGRAEGGDLGAVGDHLIGHCAHILQIVAREHGLGRIGEGRARIGAGLEDQFGVRRRDRAILLAADLDARLRARHRPGAPEDLRTGEGDLHRSARLAGELDGDGLRIKGRLAAEAAAKFRLLHLDLGAIHLEDLREAVAVDEGRLGAAPQFDLALLRTGGDAGLRLDIALVHGLGVEGALDDDVRLGEARLDIAHAKLIALHHIRRPVGADLGIAGLGALGAHVAVQDRRIRLHGGHGVDHVGQHIVFHLDELQRLLGDGLGGGGDGGDRMALVVDLLLRHDHAGHVAIGRPLLDLGEVGAGDDRLHARKLLRG